LKAKKVPAGTFAVCKLIEILKDQMNYKLFFDNWFSSPSLILELKQRGFQSVATIQISRVPGCIFSLTEKEFIKSGRGKYEQLVNKTNNLVIVRWNDNKPLHLISSYIGSNPVDKISRWVKNDGKRTLVPCPSIVRSYNKNMGGVDLADMLASLYRIDRKSRKYYTRIVYYLFSVCVNNAWILHKKNNPSNKLLLRDFILSVSESLINARKLSGKKFNFCRTVTPKPKNISSSSCIANKDTRFDKLDHWVDLVKENNQRKRCKLCGVTTTSRCIKCNVFLCLVRDKNCFYIYHHNTDTDE